ncbi:hypothetical protein OEA41_003124 [Lepraria neglecta]|uniref:Uncharacterized protein n=1 Tax=Lepraria neglecta TaxID=209136 RepID=A0AAE0DJ18_9LECA|nr:hypothetical protein OEA41_003124 [Lepraria neglecta]
MPTTTPLDLPPELIIIVFKSFGEFTSATALVRTSHKFHSVWEDSPSTITNAVLPRAIEYFDQATERLEADDKLANNQASADATHPTIQRTKRPYYLDTGMWWYTRHDSPALGVPISEDEWLDTFAREAVLLVDLQNAAHNIQDALPEQLFYYHVVRDCYQEKEELLRGFKVAELLPLLLRDGPYADVIITCLHQSQKRRKTASGMDNADKASNVITCYCQTNFSCEILAINFFG